MNCPSCKKEILPDRFFCNWCRVFIPDPKAGTMPGIFRRFLALALDPLIVAAGYVLFVIILGAIIGGLLGIISEQLAQATTIILIILFSIVYIIFLIMMLAQGQTPGKWLLGERVVNALDGSYPGFWRMVLREIIGRFISGLFFGIGYFWAIFDNNQQAWHDKIASTVVVHATKGEKLAFSIPAPTKTKIPAAAYCSQCGTKISSDSKFCQECGSPV